MAQESSIEILDSQHPSSNDQSQCSSSDPTFSRNLSFSRLNAKAPEFVPTRPLSTTQSNQQQLKQTRFVVPPPPPPPGAMIHQVYSPHPPPVTPFHVPIQSHVIPVQHHQIHHVPVQNYHQRNHNYNHNHHHHGYHQRNIHEDHEQQVEGAIKDQKDKKDHRLGGLSDESMQKVMNQVEYYFSDLNLATTDHLMRFIHKDSEGYVPISVVASFKKIKALINSNSQLASILRNSSKLMVSEDGKKVKRQHLLTESDMEELQSRIVVAENLPEDHCHQNLMKIFSTVGSVKNIRTCLPQASGGGASSASRPTKADSMPFGNKLHAFVEYETVELAEKAIAELNDDEGNWRSGLRVRLMFKRSSKPGRSRVRKGHEGELQNEEEDASTSEQQLNEQQSEDTFQQHDVNSHEHVGEEHGNEKEGGQRRGRNRGRNKGRGRGDRGQHHHNGNRGNHHIGTPPSSNLLGNEQPTAGKQPPGPRMPDGTRGFAMGRGKPIAVNIT